MISQVMPSCFSISTVSYFFVVIPYLLAWLNVEGRRHRRPAQTLFVSRMRRSASAKRAKFSVVIIRVSG
jgi:hypothetical protein